jgi:hypothetical protein
MTASTLQHIKTGTLGVAIGLARTIGLAHDRLGAACRGSDRNELRPARGASERGTRAENN